MPSTTIQRSCAALGVNFGINTSIVSDSGHIVDAPLGAAKTGTLTTRTSNTVGTLTMAAGHGITTAALLDIYWDGGSRRNVTVGTVATNSVPFSGGTGDNLPAATTAITAMVPNVETFTIVGSDIEFAGVYSQVKATFRFMQADNTLIQEYTVGAGQSQIYDGTGTNPFAGVTVGKVAISHGDSSGERTPKAVILYSS